MNKKDVLRASADAWNVQKMESPPPIGVSAGNAQNPALDMARTAGSFGAFVLSDTGQNKS